MCGIAGFSLTDHSTVNARALTHNLFAGIQSRGTDSSGFAYIDGEDAFIYKNPIPGGSLPLHDLPRRAKTAILHTRFGTQGTAKDNRNNHPLASPNGTIALVHNGVISNDHIFRDEYGGEFEGLADVDSSVIPALIERYDIRHAAKNLEGYAAVAYLDVTVPDTLFLARMDSSPVAYTWLTDGSFVFASTVIILVQALEDSGLEYGHVFSMDEGKMFTIKNGVIMALQSGLEMIDSYSAWRRYSHATSGGHGTPTTGSENVSRATGRTFPSSFGNVEEFDDDDVTDDEDAAIRAGRWAQDYRNRNSKTATFDPDEVAMAMAPESNEPPSSNVWVQNPDTGELERLIPFEEVDPRFDDDDEIVSYYVTMEDGSMEPLDDVEDIEKHLAWVSNLQAYDGMPFPDVEHGLKWTNYVVDVGHITIKRGLVSWLADLAEIDNHEATPHELDIVREGLSNILIHAAV